MSAENTISRRQFLKYSVGATGAVLLPLPAFTSAGAPAPQKDTVASYQANAWLSISADNLIELVIDRSEMGQGVITSLSMLLAEELNMDLALINTRFAPVNPVYNDKKMRMQTTGGSTSVKNSWLKYRQIAAATRVLFTNAAAKQWGVETKSCTVRNAHVYNSNNAESLRFADLIPLLNKVETVDLEEAPLKDPSQFEILGKAKKRMDSASKLDGSAVFGIDVTLPGMLIATLRQAPVFGAKLKSFDAQAVHDQPGVTQIVALENAVAVVADNYWHAKQVLDALPVQWTQSDVASWSDADMLRHWAELLPQQDGSLARGEGDAKHAIDNASTVIEAVYQLPFQAHATMEPMNCTAHVSENRCELWVPTQAPTMCREVAARITGLDHEQVFVHTTLLGGGFGRRGNVDFVEQAVRLSMQVKAPVKLIWSREEDIQHDFYRPANHNVLKAVLDKNGMPLAWWHRIVGPAILPTVIEKYSPAAMPTWFGYGLKDFLGSLASLAMDFRADPTSVEGAANMPYAIDNIQVDYIDNNPGIPVGFWRSVGSSQNAFIVESFIDELAHAANTDPFEYRRKLLKNHPRHLRVLEETEKFSAWQSPPPENHYRGMAIHESFNSVVAQVVELSLVGTQINVHQVYCVIDCGFAVNPNIIRQQMEGAIVYGLTAALKSKITINQGKVEQSNFHDFPLLRMHETPQVNLHILPSQEAPTGVGEPGVPPIAPALANAVFAASGKRIRSLPILPEHLA